MMAEQQRKEDRMKKKGYEDRKRTILNKGKELSTLCDIKLCVLIVSPDDKLETWPNNLSDVKAILNDLKGSDKPIRIEHPKNNTEDDQNKPFKKKRKTTVVNSNSVVVDDVEGKGIMDPQPIGVSNLLNQENNDAFLVEEPLPYHHSLGVNCGFAYPSNNICLDEWNGRTIGINNNSGIMGIPNCMPSNNHEYYHGPPGAILSSLIDPMANQDYFATYYSTWNENENYGQYGSTGSTSTETNLDGIFNFNDNVLVNQQNNLDPTEFSVCNLLEPLLAQPLQSFQDYSFPNFHNNN